MIKLFARVEDNDPTGPKASESPVVVVRIISQSEFERMLRVRQGMEVLMSKYRQAERRLESLAGSRRRLRKKLEGEPRRKKLSRGGSRGRCNSWPAARGEANEMRGGRRGSCCHSISTRTCSRSLPNWPASWRREADDMACDRKDGQSDLTREDAAKSCSSDAGRRELAERKRSSSTEASHSRRWSTWNRSFP